MNVPGSVKSLPIPRRSPARSIVVLTTRGFRLQRMHACIKVQRQAGTRERIHPPAFMLRCFANTLNLLACLFVCFIVVNHESYPTAIWKIEEEDFAQNFYYTFVCSQFYSNINIINATFCGIYIIKKEKLFSFTTCIKHTLHILKISP